MYLNQSYWGVQGWEVNENGADTWGGCFNVWGPASVEIHHIIFANDIANGCSQGGFAAGPSGNGRGVDYLVVVGTLSITPFRAAPPVTAGSMFSSRYSPILFRERISISRETFPSIILSLASVKEERLQMEKEFSSILSICSPTQLKSWPTTTYF
jgi:hypothetical protein